MNTPPVIQFSNVWKEYPKKDFSIFKPSYFWSLQEINFSVQQGESIAFVGTNGCGKSTALKLIAGVTQASKGRVSIRGVRAPLISIESSMSSVLTAKDNIDFIFQIFHVPVDLRKNLFRTMIEFSELEDFLDMPLKFYSTGMRSRLAFAIATELSADVFLLDESLAVGDKDFQKKSFGRLLDLKQSGKTILFTSHSALHIQKLADRVLWLEQGRVKAEGDTADVLPLYEASQSSPPHIQPKHPKS